MSAWRIWAACALLGLMAACVPGTETAIPNAPVEPLPATPTAEPVFAVPPGSPDPYSLPVGLALLSDGRLNIYALDGTLIGTREIVAGADYIYVDGPLADGAQALTVIELAQSPGELIVYVNGAEVHRIPGGLTGAVGLPGEPVLAFGASYQREGVYYTGLYVRSAADLAGALPAFWYQAEAKLNARPLRIQVLPGGAARLWYAEGPYALGGEIIFEPTHSLYYDDEGAALPFEQVLLEEPIYQPALSADAAWLAHTAPGRMQATELQSGATVSFDLLPDMDRGGGDQVFSPDNRLLAWKEAAGTRLGDPPSYRSVARVGSLADGAVLDLDGSFFPGASVFDLTPVGWLDARTLVVEVQYADWTRGVWAVTLPGPAARPVGQGEFVGLLYP